MLLLCLYVTSGWSEYPYRSSGRPFTSRFLKSRHLSSSDDEASETDEQQRRRRNDANDERRSNVDGNQEKE